MNIMTDWKKQNCGRRQSAFIGNCITALCIVLITGACQPTPPPGPPVSNPNTLCFNPSVGVPGVSGPPTVNGVIAGDLGWTDSFRYLFVNGSTVPDTIAQGIKDNNNLYLSFEVNNDTSFDDNDVIVLTFDPGDGPSNHRRIHIFPVFQGVGAAVGGAPREVDYWTDSSTWNTNAATKIVNPAWLVNNIRVASASSGASQNHWYVEMKIPITGAPSAGAATDTGINFPASGTFGFYMDVIRVATSAGSSTAAERVWPPGAPTIFPFLEANTPAPGTWGKGTLGGSICNGVSVYSSTIITNNTPPSVISLNSSNIFSALVYNTTTNATGTFIAANKVKATFKIANWGIPGASNWALVPAAGNPTSSSAASATIPAATMMAAGTSTLSTGAWVLGAQTQTPFAANTHQCILVELDSDDPGTVFVNKSAWTNMDFAVTASPFEASAKVGTKGYKLPPGQDSHEFILTEYDYNTDPVAKWVSQIRGVQQIGPRQHTLRARPETDADLFTSVTPPNVKIPSLDVSLVPGAGGPDQKPMVVQVKPGDLVTVIAEGLLRLRRTQERPFDQPVGPNGIDVGEKFAGEQYLLSKQQNPYTRVGALIGSWDGFKESSFIVGQAATLKVPKNAIALHLAINDFAAGYKEQSGEGYRIQVVETPLEKYYMFTDSIVSRDPSAETLQIPLGANLPTVIFCAQRKLGETLTINGTKYDLVEDQGCYGYIFKRIGGQ